MLGGESRAAVQLRAGSRLGVLGSQERRARLPRGAAGAVSPRGRRGYRCRSPRSAAPRAAGAPSGSLPERGSAAGEAAPPARRGGAAGTVLSVWLIHPPSLKIWTQRVASRHPAASALVKAPPRGRRDEVQKENPCAEGAAETVASGPIFATHGSEDP